MAKKKKLTAAEKKALKAAKKATAEKTAENGNLHQEHLTSVAAGEKRSA